MKNVFFICLALFLFEKTMVAQVVIAPSPTATPDASSMLDIQATDKGLLIPRLSTSPLGNEVARLESGANGATLTRAGAAAESADSFQALTEKLLGVALDPGAIAGWLHGNAPASAPGEWKVSIDESQRAGSVDLAKRITATRGGVVVKLVVDEYRALEE